MAELVIGICDDLEAERSNLARMVRSYCRRREQSVRLRLFSGGEELLAAVRGQGDIQILFLDIYMPGLSGMETARRVRELDGGIAIVFATTSQDHGMDSFAVQASDYLVKPFREEDVARALDWCLEHIPESLRCLSVYAEGERREIPLTAIRYIEVLGHQCRVHTQREIVVTRRGLDDLESAVDSGDFLRCHRSFLVNMNAVRTIEGSDFRMEDGALVPIGSSNAPRVRRLFLDWTYSKAWVRS